MQRASCTEEKAAKRTRWLLRLTAQQTQDAAPEHRTYESQSHHEDLKAIAPGLGNSMCPGFHCPHSGASPAKPAPGRHLWQPPQCLGLKNDIAQHQQRESGAIVMVKLHSLQAWRESKRMRLKRQRLHTSCVVSAVWFNTSSTQQAEVVQEAGKGGGGDQLSPDFPPAVLQPLDTTRSRGHCSEQMLSLQDRWTPRFLSQSTLRLPCRFGAFGLQV